MTVNRATLDYFANPYGSTAANLALMMAATKVPVDTSFLHLNAVSVISDTCIETGGRARRRVVINIAQPLFLANGNNAPVDPQTGEAVPFQLGIASTSSEDAAAGTGVRTVTITYLDPTGSTQTETLTLTGTTEVLSTNIDYNSIVSVTFASTGSFSSSKGQLMLKSHPIVAASGSATSQFRTVRGVKPIGGLPPSFYMTGDLTGVIFANLMTSALESMIGPAITAAVVMSTA